MDQGDAARPVRSRRVDGTTLPVAAASVCRRGRSRPANSGSCADVGIGRPELLPTYETAASTQLRCPRLHVRQHLNQLLLVPIRQTHEQIGQPLAVTGQERFQSSTCLGLQGDAGPPAIVGVGSTVDPTRFGEPIKQLGQRHPLRVCRVGLENPPQASPRDDGGSPACAGAADCRANLGPNIVLACDL